VIGAPRTNISGVQPERRSTVAPRISQRYVTAEPSAARASMRSQECGFTKSSPAIVPTISNPTRVCDSMFGNLRPTYRYFPADYTDE
jgi:hypothetical protein